MRTIRVGGFSRFLALIAFLLALAIPRVVYAQAASCGIANPTRAEIIECLSSLNFQSACAQATADFITDEQGGDLGDYGGCATRGDCFEIAVGDVGGICIGGGGGTGVAGPGTAGDVAQEAVTSTFVNEVVDVARPAAVEQALAGEGAPGERVSVSYSSVDANATFELWDADSIEGNSYQIALGYESVGTGGFGFFVDGAYTFIDPDKLDATHTFQAKVGFRDEAGDVFVWGLYATGNYVDLEPDAVLLGGGGFFAGLRFDLSMVKLSIGTVGQGVVSDIELPDDKVDYGISVAYGAGLGLPLGDLFAVNAQLYRTTPFKEDSEGDLGDVGSFTTVAASADFAISPAFALNAGYRTRFEIDNYDTNAFIVGMKAFF